MDMENTPPKRFICDDGGRKAAGFTGAADDCVVRAIAIAVGVPYAQVYDDLFALNKLRNRNPKRCSPRDANTAMTTVREYMASRYGWHWRATMTVGSGCRVHLRADELPAGRLVVRVSKHVCAMIDGVIRDTHDCSRDGTRCVYGYFYNPNA